MKLQISKPKPRHKALKVRRLALDLLPEKQAVLEVFAARTGLPAEAVVGRIVRHGRAREALDAARALQAAHLDRVREILAARGSPVDPAREPF